MEREHANVAEQAKQYLTTRQVNQRYPFLAEGTLRYWRHNGGGPESCRIGGRVLYRLDRLEEWLQAQEDTDKRGGVA